jgi:hypothetical protein
MPNNNTQQAVYLQSGSAANENRAADGYSGGQLGIRFTIAPQGSQEGQEWQLVQNDSTMAVVPTRGAVAWWLDRTKFLVTTAVATAGRGNVAGVYQGPSDVGNICCIQRKGLAQVQPGTGTPSTLGLIVVPSATAAKADALAAGTAASYPSLGRTVGATSATETGLFPCMLNVDSGVV